MAAPSCPNVTYKLALCLPHLSAWVAACASPAGEGAGAASESEDDARNAASMVLNIIQAPFGSGLERRILTLSLLDAMMFQEQGDELLKGVSAGHYCRLRQFILSESSNPSFRLLTPPPSTTTALETPSPSTSIPRFCRRDVLLECSDWTRHLAHSYVLAFHSPLLGKKIEAAMDSGPSARVSDSPSHNGHRQPPVVSLDVRPETLAVLLGFCYDTTQSPPPQLPVLALALLASRRYEMRQVEKLIAARWDELAKLSPLEAYFVAVQTGPELEGCARAAAMVVLEHPIPNSYLGIMESSSALAYRRILEYHKSCTGAVEGHLNRVITRWNAGPQASQGLRHQDTVDRFLKRLVQHVQDHGPRSSLDVDATRLFRRFCSSDSTQGDILWPGLWWPECGWVVNGLLDTSALPQATEHAIDRVNLNL